MIKPLSSSEKTSSRDVLEKSSSTVDGDETGLTDDQRVSREGESKGSGARVKPGPADEQRTDKSSV